MQLARVLWAHSAQEEWIFAGHIARRGLRSGNRVMQHLPTKTCGLCLLSCGWQAIHWQSGAHERIAKHGTWAIAGERGLPEGSCITTPRWDYARGLGDLGRRSTPNKTNSCRFQRRRALRIGSAKIHLPMTAGDRTCSSRPDIRWSMSTRRRTCAKIHLLISYQGGNDLEQELDVWKRAGDGFAGLGGGTMFSWQSGRAAFVELAVHSVFPFSALVVVPSVGVVMGF